MWHDYSVAQPPSRDELLAAVQERKLVGRGSQAEVHAYRFRVPEGESSVPPLVMKPCRKQVAHQEDPCQMQEYEIGVRLAAARRYIPMTVPILAWWPPRSSDQPEGLCMSYVGGPSIWNLYGSPLYNARTSDFQTQPQFLKALYDVDTWRSLMLCILWGVHQLQVTMHFQHNDFSYANILLLPLHKLKRGARVRLDFGAPDMVYEVPLPWDQRIGVFFPQIIDPSHSTCKCEHTGFQIGHTSARRDPAGDELFKHSVGYSGGFHAMSDVSVLFKNLVDLFCFAWSRSQTPANLPLMRMLLDGANLSAFALGLPETELAKAQSPTDIYNLLREKFKSGTPWLSFHSREINAAHHPYLRDVLDDLDPLTFYTRMPKTELQPRFSRSPLELVRQHSEPGRLFHGAQPRDDPPDIDLRPPPPSFRMRDELARYLSSGTLGDRVSAARCEALDRHTR